MTKEEMDAIAAEVLQAQVALLEEFQRELLSVYNPNPQGRIMTKEEMGRIAAEVLCEDLSHLPEAEQKNFLEEFQREFFAAYTPTRPITEAEFELHLETVRLLLSL